MEINHIIATNLKLQREKNGLSLDKLAALTGVSKSMLGQIERGVSSPSISVLWKIANGLKISFTSLTKPSQKEIKIYTKNEPIIADDGRYILHSVIPFDEDAKFETYFVEMKKDAYLKAEAHFTGTKEYVHVQEGRLEMIVDGKSNIVEANQAITYHADVIHEYRNLADSTKFSLIIKYD